MLVRVLALTLLLAVIVSCEPVPTRPGSNVASDGLQHSSHGGEIVAAASGHGEFAHPVSGVHRVFSFTAGKRSDGSAGGHFLLKHLGGNRFEGVVTCMYIDGNGAQIGGRVLRSTFTPWVGQPVGFAVEDNGQGGDPAPDRMSLLLSGTEPVVADFCDGKIILDPDRLFTIVRGEIDVRY